MLEKNRLNSATFLNVESEGSGETDRGNESMEADEGEENVSKASEGGARETDSKVPRPLTQGHPLTLGSNHTDEILPW